MDRKNISLLVFNEAPAVSRIQNLLCNILPAKCRVDTMEGRQFVVVPMVILTEGVHTGSEGPVYYPPDELSKTPACWNHKPVVVYHPEMNGQGISACDPVVITNRKVGVMMNTRFEGGRLKSEAWLEKDRADLVDSRILAAVEKNEMMELSTGVFIDMDRTPGEWKGEAYKGVARNYRPDHLALLPDKIGACSIKDGAGFLRNHSGADREALLRVFQQAMIRSGIITENEMSFSNIRERLTTALRKRFDANTPSLTSPSLFVEDVYTDFAIYESKGKLFRIGYSATDTAVTLSDDAPVEVVRVTEYRTIQGAFVGNEKEATNPEISMNKQLIDKIIANAKSPWKEADRPKLETFTEDQLKAIQNSLESPPPAPAPVLAANAQPTTSAGDDTTAANAAPAVISVAEYVRQAPPEVQEVLNNSLSMYAQEKGRVIATIIANKQNTFFTKDDLDKRPLAELQAIARLAGGEPAALIRTLDYAGQGGVPLGNRGGDEEEAMALPVINFSKAAA